MTRIKPAYKYETLLKGLYEIFHTWINGTSTLQTGAVTTRVNIINIRPYNTPIVEVRNLIQEV